MSLKITIYNCHLYCIIHLQLFKYKFRGWMAAAKSTSLSEAETRSWGLVSSIRLGFSFDLIMIHIRKYTFTNISLSRHK